MKDEVKRMIADIEREARYTRRTTGREAFAPRVMEAMARVPRDRFVPAEMRTAAFENGPLPIGFGQTISQPYIVALMTDMLQLDDDATVLEVGTGSGYQTAILCELCRQVYSIEVVAELSEQASARLKTLGYDNVETCVGDGYQGWPEHAPYDGIIVTAAASRIPDALVEQLKPGGRLAIPVGEPYSHQELILVEKDAAGGILRRDILAVAFVPLIETSGQHH
jgi:protein-L-isoaspartate(D-aspartate) O-methyltransferase